MITHNGNIYVGTPAGPYLSTDDGQTWNAILTGLDVTTVNDIVVSNGKILVAVNGGGRLFVTTNEGDTWLESNTGLSASAISDLAVTPGHVFGMSNIGVLNHSRDDGATWEVVSTAPTEIQSITTSGNHLYAGTATDGVFWSDDHGETWTSMSSGLEGLTYINMESYQDLVIAATNTGVYLSTNKGASWTNTGLPVGYPAFTAHEGTLIYSNTLGAYRSTNNGASWSPISELDGAECITWHENAFMAGNYYGVYKSVNDGVSWSETNEGLTNATISGFAELNNKLFVSSIGVYRSTDQGDNWDKVSTGLPVKFTSALTSSNNALLVSFYEGGIYRSVNEGNSWTQVSTASIRTFTRKGTLLLAGGDDGFFVSTNDGGSWTRRSTIKDIAALTVQGNRIFAGRFFGSMVIVSDDDGQTWSPAVTGLPASYISNETLFAHGGKVFAGPANVSIYSTANNGASWQMATTGLTGTTRQIFSFGARGTVLFTGTDSGVYFSENIGESWTAMNDQLPVIDISNGVGKLFGGQKYLFSGHTQKGVWRWNPPCNLPTPFITVQVTETDTTLISNASIGNQWYLDGVPIEGATGQTWTPVSSGTYTVVVTVDHCTSQTSNSKLVTRVVFNPLDPLIEMPNVFTPDGDSFNPVFVPITFQDIPKAYLQIFDRWGKRVYSTDDLNTGWNGGDYPTAVYYYLITYKSPDGASRQVKGWVQLLR